MSETTTIQHRCKQSGEITRTTGRILPDAREIRSKCPDCGTCINYHPLEQDTPFE